MYSIWTDVREVGERKRGGREVFLKPCVYLDLQCCVVLRGIAKVLRPIYIYYLPSTLIQLVLYANTGKLL